MNQNVSTSERADCSDFYCANIDSVLITENVFTFRLLGWNGVGAIKMMPMPLFFRLI